MNMAQTQTGALLHNDHVATIQTLQTLEGFLTRQTPKRPPDVNDPPVRKMLGNLIATVNSEVGRHFTFEEEHLFPRLADAGEENLGEFLKQEHASILPLANACAEAAAKAMEEGFTEAGWKQFFTDCMELIEREIFHIQKEEMGLLAAISMLIDPETDGELAMTFQSMN